jgi:uncharacterized membrane protein
MNIFLIGLVLFLGVHSVRIFADGFRARTIERVGLNAWKGIYTLLSLAGFVLLVHGYGVARLESASLWNPPRWTYHATALLTLFAFILVAAGYVRGNRIKARVGHPMVAGVKLWAFAHLLSNGRVVDVILFGAILAWSVADFISARRRDRAAGVVYPVLGGSRDMIAIVAGTVAYLVFALWAHGWLIGVKPFGG